MGSPIPIPVPMEQNDAEFMNDSLTADEIRRVLPEPITIHKTEESEDEHKDNEVEEKAMELMETPSDNIQHIENVNQSMKIPQHSYDMNLIPEYDPTKYMQSNVVNQEEEDNENEDDDDVKRTNNHYSSSYLDTYSTLMDIPQITANDDMSDHKQENDYDQNQDKTEEDDEEKENDDDDDEDEDDEDNDDQDDEDDNQED